MNEGTKTGVFWCVAVVMLAIAAFVAWPTKSIDQEQEIIGGLLFPEFKDPVAAASMKIVTFDDDSADLDVFEVRKNRENGLWTIPLKGGYPADAVEQMKDAANAFVGLKVLDIQTSNAEDHDDLGVSEPKLDDLEIGDEGVGRLVTFKDESQKVLASLIIGEKTKDNPEHLYVRIPGQDPVYVVKFDESSLTTNFPDWIQDDLLQLSSIDIQDVAIKDYSFSVGLDGPRIDRKYDAKVVMDGSQWKLDKLMEYDANDALAPPTPVQVDPTEQLNSAKFNEMKNALDDLKIVDVKRKPDGMSVSLRVEEEMTEDAVRSLSNRGFYPVRIGGEKEILSANGEMSIGLKDGVMYTLRFGKMSGLTEKTEGGDEAEQPAGVNRYLLVTTQVDESRFPSPELKQVPNTLEELELSLFPPVVTPAEPESTEDAEATESTDEPESTKEDEAANTDETSTEDDADPVSADETDGEESEDAEATADENSEESADEEAVSDEAAAEDSDGEEEAEVVEDEAGQEETASEEETVEVEQEPAAADETSEEKSDAPEEKTLTPEEQARADWDKLTAEEKQERLEAEQEMITKENQRKMDERKDKIETASRRVRDLNERFADWYYVIPEDTYTKLRIGRDELFQKEGDAMTPPPGMQLPGGAGPSFPPTFPGAPGN